MQGKVGLWIDHSKAILVELDEQVSTQTLESKVERKGRAKGGAPAKTPYGPQDAVYEARRDRRYQHHLNEYYDGVVRMLDGAAAILIIGPGQARSELRKKLVASGVDPGLIRTEASDKMTENQIVEKVKTHYGYTTRATSELP